MALISDGKLVYLLEVDDKGSAVVKRFSGNVDKLGKSTERASSKSKKLNSSIFEMRRLLPVVGIGLLIKELGSLSDTYIESSSRLSLVTKSQKELIAVQADLSALTRETRGDWTSTLALYARMARATKELKIPQQDLLTVTKAINQAIVVSGSSQTEAAAAIMQLSQGMASGVLRTKGQAPLSWRGI